MVGTVFLVGAGPGDPELLTVKARRLLDEADVVLYDALTDDRLHETLLASTTTIDVGKKPNGDRTTQAEINDMLVSHASDGARVVRLKGGDPFVFGRGGEEAEYLASQNIPFEIVPGVTSAIAGPGVAGIPVTHRDHSSSVTVLTGHEDPTKDESALRWCALAEMVQAGGTLVILMGVGKLPDNVSVLKQYGLSPETPVAMVERATWADEQVVTGTLDTIVEKRDEQGIEPPAVTVIGDVVSVREELRTVVEQQLSVSTPAESVSAAPAHQPGTASSALGAQANTTTTAETAELTATDQPFRDQTAPSLLERTIIPNYDLEE